MTDLEQPDDPRDTAKLKAVLLVVATVAFVVTPLITQPFTGFDPAQLPVPVDDPPIQPEGYAFSIWGVIYLWLLGSAGYGLIKRDTAQDWDAGRWGLIVSIAIGASWIAIALRDPVIATALIWVMLIGALWALVRAPSRDRAWNALPLGLYAGWLTAASCVALGTVAMGYGLASPAVISWAGLALALAIALPLTRRLRVATYPIAVGWALVGVVVANAATLPVFAAAAGLGAAMLLWLAVRQARA
ncbi:MAG: tryptophan-rich sensory protein [Roseicyclus sp.]|nr:tryptophan-rich sensory protein [Roseicyclus sp.]